MANFNVHVFTMVRVSLHGITARHHRAAVVKAEKGTDWHSLCRCPDVEWAEEHASYCVDPVKKGKVDFDSTKWFGPNMEEGVGSYDDILCRLLSKKENLPVLMGLDPELDKLVALKLKE